MLGKKCFPFTIFVLVGIFMVMFNLNAGLASAADKPIQLKLASFQPPTSKSSEYLGNWAKKIEKETNGKVKIVLYAGATLAKPKQTYDAVVNGVADMGWTLAGYTRGRFPLSEIVDLPLGFRNAEHGARVLNDLYDKYPDIGKEYKDTHLLWLCPGPIRQIHSKVPVRTLAAFKGLKVRVPGSEAPNAKALGGVPVSMPGSEVYLALERGVIDADFHPWESAHTYRWYEIVKYHTKADLYIGGLFIFVMNRNTWSKLPADVKKVIERNSGRKTSINSSINMWDKWESFYYDWLKKNTKNEISEWSKEDKAQAQKQMKDAMLEKWVADAKAKGVPGREMLNDAMKLIKKY